MTVEVWRPFAWRAFWLWVALHAVVVLLVATVVLISGEVPAPPGPAQGAWMVAATATLLGIDIARARERLLLHNLGVRLRLLIPLAMAPAALAELLLIAMISA